MLRLQPGVGKFRTPSRADADSEKMRPLSASSGGLQKRKAQEATGRMVFQAGGVTRFK